MTTTLEPWRPGKLAAGAIIPGDTEWDSRFMLLFLDDAARGLHPDMGMDRMESVSAMYRAVIETEQIIRKMMTPRQDE